MENGFSFSQQATIYFLEGLKGFKSGISFFKSLAQV